jgi:DNA-binding beta-propeller fold protein YncE
MGIDGFSGGLTLQMNYVTQAPTGTPTITTFATGFSSPSGVAVDSSGNVYVGDQGNNLVSKITPGGSVSTLATGLNNPRGVAVDSSGNVYVADQNNNRIAKITPGGSVSNFATGITAPIGVTVDSSGNVYVAANSNVYKITSGGSVSTLASGLTNPFGVAVDSLGNVYVTELNLNRILKITISTGAISVYAGSGSVGSQDGPGASATFNWVYGITIDSVGNLYIGDFNNNSVRKITTDAVVSTVATGFNNPRGVAIDSTGNVLYVADSSNNRIRKIVFASPVD